MERQGRMMQEQKKVITHLKGRLTNQSTSLSYVCLTLENYIILLLQVIKRQGRMMQEQEKVINHLKGRLTNQSDPEKSRNLKRAQNNAIKR